MGSINMLITYVNRFFENLGIELTKKTWSESIKRNSLPNMSHLDITRERARERIPPDIVNPS